MIRPGSTKATNNDLKFIHIKIELRKNAFEKYGGKVLSCFHGNGDLYRWIEKKNIVSIDANNIFQVDYVMNCKQFIKQNEINCYKIIDLDCWGSPFAYIEQIRSTGYKGCIIATYCIPVNLNPCKTLLNVIYGADFYGKIKRKSMLCIPADYATHLYLEKIGATDIIGYFSKKKCYFKFNI